MPHFMQDPWFALGDGPAVHDFWDIYGQSFAAIECPTHVGPRRVHELLTAAFVEQSWAGFEELLRRLGRTFATQGRDPTPLLVSSVVRVTSPGLVEAYGAEPKRLCAALTIAEQFGQRRIATLRDAFQHAHGAAWAQQSVAMTLDSIGDGVISTDSDGLVERMNRVALRLSAWTLDDARGEPLEDVFRVVDEETGLVVPSRIEEVLSDGIVVSLPRHSAILAKNATLLSIGDSMAPIYDDAGHIQGAVVVFRDRTKERDDERTMESVHLALAHSQRLVEELIDKDQAGLVADLQGKLQTFRADLRWVLALPGADLVATSERLASLLEVADQIQGRITATAK